MGVRRAVGAAIAGVLLSTLAAPTTVVLAASGPTKPSAAQATEAFGLNMLRKLPASGNLVFSPDSIEAALSMAGVGAAGQTATQMAGALALPGPSSFAAIGRLQATLAGEQSKAAAADPGGPSDSAQPIFTLGNGIFVGQGFSLLAPFQSTLQSSFDATPQAVDFSTPSAVQTINAYIAQQTHGVFPNLLSPQSLAPTTLLALVNALYFKAKWQSPFDAGKTAPDRFTTTHGTSTVPFMNQTFNSLKWANVGGVSAIDLPYEYSPFSMLVVLPAQSQTAQKLQAGLTPAALNGLIGHLANKPVIVSLPKFHITLSATSIIPQLKALGMKDAFSVGGADFSKLSTTAAYIGATYHAADIRVNEDGTIATAVTVVGVEPEDDAQPPQNAVHFDANRPFLFFLRDDTTGALLFAGRVDDPAAAQ